MKHYQNTSLEPFFSYDLFHIEDMVHSSSDPMDILLEIEKFIGKNNDQDDIEEAVLPDFEPPDLLGVASARLEKNSVFN